MGERTPLALLDPAASGRMAVAEAITNIVAADVRRIEDIRLSANWMAACGEPGEDADLYDTVHAVGEEFCPALGIAIPVGKDSLSMKTAWRDGGEERRVVAPVSLIVSAFAPVGDVRRTLTPQLRLDRGDTRLLLIDLGAAATAWAARVSRRCTAASAHAAADCDDPAAAAGFLRRHRGHCADAVCMLAYHDRSDGGLFATLVEMAFAGHCGLEVSLRGGADASIAAALFAEELGAVVQVRSGGMHVACSSCSRRQASATARAIIGQVDRARSGRDPSRRTALVLASRRPSCVRPGRRRAIGCRRCATIRHAQRRSARARIDPEDPGLFVRLTFDPCRGHRRADAESRRAAASRDAARAGRQQPAGDGRGLRSRRIRAARRAHDGPDRPARRGSTTSRASSPAAAFRTATCSAPAKAGPSRSCSTPALARAVRGFLRRGPTASRWASATAARCSRR